MAAPIFIGTHTYAAAGDAARRQANGVQSLLALAGVEAVNVQFARDPHHVDGVATLAALLEDSTTATGRTGSRRPVTREIFDVLARHAAARRCAYFCFTNADIVWSQQAVDWILGGGRQACLFSRRDFDGATGADRGIELSGTDAFAIAAPLWPRIRRRFRGYLVGETCWDNVYTAVLMCHADAAIENRRGLLRHEQHASNAPAAEPFAQYSRLLAALDARYFHLWCRYWDRLRTLRAQGASEEAEQQLARAIFVWPPPFSERVIQAVRSGKARLRYAWYRVRQR